MMSLVKISLADVVKKQYLYKLIAYKGTYTTLIFLQLVGLLMNDSVSSGSNGYFLYDIAIHSTGVSVGLTMLWAFMVGIIITTKLNRDDDFMYVSNRLSSNLANILFLVTASVLSGVTAMLCGFLIKDILYFFADDLTMGNILVEAPSEFLIGIFASILYVLLMSALGYLLGVLVQLNRVVFFLIPVLYIGLTYLKHPLIEGIIPFYLHEASIGLFAVKVIVTVVVCYGLAVAISNRLEVKS